MRARLVLALAWLCAVPGAMAQDGRKSGFEYMSRDSQALQMDDLSNPAMLSVLDGESLWSTPAGSAQKSCASCHGDASVSMKGVAARYPAFNEGSGTPIDLAGRIDQCRRERQAAPALAREGRDSLALTAYIGLQSRGLPISPPDDTRLAPFRREGEALYTRRMGQLNFSCAQCHDEHAGDHVGASPIPQAHPTAYPIYRLEWQSVGSLQRRLRNCMAGTRSEPFAYGSPEFINLELFLAERARGMKVETPGVRP
ncbi:MAG: diheme cytochrome C/sulfur oxidizing protein soxA [Hyphomicrobiales bacterium]|nr:diheme cytochrome C/sulfur oxidizing protein soxA [Hyphomicrobiales bacterium]